MGNTIREYQAKKVTKFVAFLTIVIENYYDIKKAEKLFGETYIEKMKEIYVNEIK